MSAIDPTTAWLLGEGPDPGDSARRDFLEAEVPPELAQDTLAAGLALFETAGTATTRSALRLHSGGRVRRLLAGAGTVAALAAAVLLALPTGPQQGDLDGMTPRGLGADLPALDLRMAVRSDGAVDRLRADRTYGSGDIFYFRYEAAADGWLHLLHATSDGIQVLESQPVEQGNADLARHGEPLAWTVDESDPDRAVFALVRTALPIDGSALSGALRDALGSEPATEPGSLCQAATALELSCDAQAVRVQR